MRKRTVKIYQSRLHLAVTFIILAVPFLFLLGFSWFAHIENGKLFLDLLDSFLRLLLAYIIAAALGWFFAVSFHKGRSAAIMLPLFDVFQSFPLSAALPFAVVFLGVSNITVILFLGLEIIWSIFFSIVSSLKLLKHEWEQVVYITDLRGINYLRYFLFPVSIPGLITGSILGLGNGWEALVAIEIIVGIKTGLGNFFQGFSHNTFISALGILGLLLFVFSINKLIWLPLLEWSHKKMEE